MTASDKKKKQLIILLFSLVALVVFLLCLFRTIAITGQENSSLIYSDSAHSGMQTWNEGWTLQYESGETENIELPCTIHVSGGENVTIVRNLSETDTPEVIEFDNLRQAVTVTTDLGDLCRINTTDIAKGMIFTDLQIVKIPDDKNITELSVIITADAEGNCSLPEIFCGTLTAARYEILMNDVFTFVLLILFVVLILILTITGIIFVLKRTNDFRIWVLDAFLVLVFLWGASDSYLPVILQIPQEILGIIEYMSLMAMPVPIGAYIWVSFRKKSKILPVMIIIDALNVILEGLLSIFGVIQLNRTFLTGHILIIITVIVSVSAVIKEREKNGRKMENAFIFCACIIQAVTSVASVLLYWLIGGSYYRITLLTGTLLFVISLFGAVLSRSSQNRREQELKISELQISERLSKYDQLTGLANRRCYEEKLEEIEKNCKTDAVMIMLDVNGLKITNDLYGHTAGDDLIVTAAKVLQVVYHMGYCYRIGGDEFVVILTDLSRDITTLNDELDAEIERRNEHSLWKLSIARGASHLINSLGNRISISDWKQEADVKMYQNKISMSKGKTRDMAKDFKDIIDCIVSTVEAKDSFTASHSERVRELSVDIGSWLGLSGETMMNLDTAAQLHDLGKIGVPDQVLFKEGSLSSEEYDLMKRHVTVGADILSRAKGMKEVSNIVLHHHERYDGKGYPEGISGKDIPIESRIIAIADSIDAMTSKRVFRSSMSIDECRSEIEKNMGLMYDPAIAQIVLEHWTEIQDIILLHPKRLGLFEKA